MSKPLKDGSWIDHLETIHRQISDDSEGPNSEGTNIDAPASSSQGHLEQKKHSMFSALLSKKSSSSSLPVFAGSSSHHGVLAANSGQDMNFVMGLSENLLLECRKLQADIETKSKSLDSVNREHNALQENFENLNFEYATVLQQLHSAKGMELDLTSKVKSFTDEIRALKDELLQKEKIIQNQVYKAEVIDIGTATEHSVTNESTDVTEGQSRVDKGEITSRSEEVQRQNKIVLPIDKNEGNTSLETELKDARDVIRQLKEDIKELSGSRKVGEPNDFSTNSQHGLSHQDSLSEENTKDFKNSTIFGVQNSVLALPNDDSSIKLHEQVSSNDSAIKRLELDGYKVLSFPEYNELKQTVSMFAHPSDNSLISQLKGREKYYRSDEAHNVIKDLSLTEVINELQAKGYYVLSSDNYQILTGTPESCRDSHLHETLISDGQVLAQGADTIKNKKLFADEFEISTKELPELQGRVSVLSEKELHEYAARLDLHILSKAEFDAMAHPSLANLEEEANKKGYSILKTNDFEDLKTDASSPSITKIKQFAKDHDYFLVRAKDISNETSHSDQSLESLCESGSYVLLNSDAYDTLMKGGLDHIKKKEVVKLCSKFNLVPVEAVEYDKITREPDYNKVERYAAENASVVITRENYEILKSEAEFPTEEAVERFAKQRGLSLVNTSEFSSMLEKIDNPSKHYLEKQAERQGLAVVSAEQYSSVLKIANSKSTPTKPSAASKVSASKQYFEEVIRNEKEKPEKILEFTKTLGFVTLSNAEYKTLKENQKDRVVTKTDIYHGAKSYDLAVLPNEEYKALLKKRVSTNNQSISELEQTAARFEMKLVPFSWNDSGPISAKENTVNPASERSERSVLYRECQTTGDGRRALSSVSDHILKRSVSEPSIRNLSTDEGTFASFKVSDQHSSKGCKDWQSILNNIKTSLVTSHEFLSLNAEERGPQFLVDNAISCETKASENQQDLELLAQREKKVISPEKEYKGVQTKPSTKENIQATASKLGLTVISKDVFENMKQRSIITKENVEAKASEFGLKVLSHEIFEALEAKRDPQSFKIGELESSAQKFGYVLITKERLLEFQNIEDSQSLGKDVANRHNQNLLDKTKLEEFAKELDLVVLEKEQYETMTKPPLLTKEQLAEQASKLHLMLLTPKKYETLKKKPSLREDEILEQAKNHDLVVMSKEKYKLLEQPPLLTKQQLVQQIKQYDLVALDESHFQDLKHHPKITKEQLISYARDFDLVAISCEDFKSMKKSPSREQLARYAQNLGFVIVGYREYENLKRASSKARPQGRNSAKRDMSPVSNNIQKDYAKLTTEGHVDFSNLINLAIKNGLLRHPEGKSFARPTKPQDVVLLPKCYYDELIAMEKNTTQHVFHDSLSSPRKRHGARPVTSISQQRNSLHSPSSSSRAAEPEKRVASAQDSTLNIHGTSAIQQQSGSPRGTSMRRALKKTNFSQNSRIASEALVTSANSLSGVSLASEVSLTEANIIPVLTQTVIGAYLFKYHRFLGVESRHERFFWIHPYTLTLYWSTTNPVLETNLSTHKTRSAAILGVESVPDSNPYPAGLYHKSLIISSEHKSVKVTCPTRSSHNIWYNSLKYLLQRSMEGTKLDNVAEDLNDVTYSSGALPLSGDMSGSNTFSSLRRLPRSKSSKKGLVPRSSSMSFKKK